MRFTEAGRVWPSGASSTSYNTVNAMNVTRTSGFGGLMIGCGAVINSGGSGAATANNNSVYLSNSTGIGRLSDKILQKSLLVLKQEEQIC
ncbi:MAG: hypothetical protein FWF23_00200 [Alphaproteobacteria bacterium]|nr:hypothetical protein [Alphaproteobacteria bacterium]MCL2504844.1 hypothetical protein [Alphaproteobacteria bacterium]